MGTENKSPKYDIEVELSNYDGNAFVILGKVQSALKKAGASKEDVAEFLKEAMGGDYDHLLRTCMKWVDVS